MARSKNEESKSVEQTSGEQPIQGSDPSPSVDTAAQLIALQKQLAETQAALAKIAANPADPAMIAEFAEMKKVLAAKGLYTTKRVAASAEPSPNDVMPGLVWAPNVDQEGNPIGGGKFVPHHAVNGRFEIIASVSGFSQHRGGVQFRDGVGRTNDPELATWFKTLGYTVTEK